MVVELRARPSGRWWVPAVWTLAAVVLIGLSMAFVDRPVATFSHDVLHRPGWAELLTRLALVPLPLSVLGLLAVGVTWLLERQLTTGWRTVLAAACATLLATGAVLLLKYAFGRMWPDTWVEHNPSWIHDHAFGFLPFHGGRGFASFPSGHTTRMTAPFAVLWHQYPRWRPLWTVPTLLVMLGLLGADFHWFSDCLAGIWLGAACAWAVLLVV
ncbi:MAG: phosphatase PAP2 family protein [Rhodospirillales bacterium]